MIVGLCAGQYLSQWTRYRQVSRKTPGGAKSLRDQLAPTEKRLI